ncbi:uncharacterized protein MELLADRAFT_109838 [Melampsora larici-populina 98AG31]|uniref:Peroxisomal membrane protein PEX14-like KPWE domain-containing protein n=1 Tax=Melampsora larici-populina (strain 98AG31 / pathotype 3-4-7) TaxID=747676 RepID=F4RXT0_MELLP|nr:uncharacterized protein MELLADRAFT_109838 [Melampsora larici-populina 98AG31]EGG02782.1 hypothetical protein MELLADRAFT_109838 [Melampsora larici-populina 98AG31]
MSNREEECLNQTTKIELIAESDTDKIESNEESHENEATMVDNPATPSVDLNQNSNQMNLNQNSQPTYPLPFNELVELINSGIELNESNLPGYKTIADRLNPEKPSQPGLANQSNSALKPWQIHPP